MLTLIAVLIGLFFYFLPAVIGRNKRDFMPILMLNIFLGWSVVGWIVALVWACANDKPHQGASRPPTENSTVIGKPDKYDRLAKLKELFDNQVLSDIEYQIEKDKILSE